MVRHREEAPPAPGPSKRVRTQQTVSEEVANRLLAIQEQASDATVVKIKLPPIFTTQRDSDALKNELAKCNLKPLFKRCITGTKIVCSTRDEYTAVGNFLQHHKQEFYTHDVAASKPFKAVLHGLADTEPNTILKELQELGLKPEKVFRMMRHNTGVDHRDVLFLVHFAKNSVNMEKLRSVRALFSTIVEWKRYKPVHRDVTQCTNCHGFGHGTRNCHMLPKCGSCGDAHKTQECKLPDDAEPKCINCGSNHRATNRDCPKRAEFIQIRKKSSTKNQPKRRNDPVPEVNSRNYPTLQPRRPIPVLPPLPLNQRMSTAAASVPSGPHTAHATFASPPGFQWRHDGPSSPPRESEPSLYTSAEMWSIFTEMHNMVKQCKTRDDQIQVIGYLLYNYGVK